MNKKCKDYKTENKLCEELDTLRDKDCVNIDMCYKPHGDAVFISLGENENKKIIGSGDSLVGALENAVSEVK